MAEDEKLIGDIAEVALKAVRADRVSRAMSRITGKPCNCNQRKMRLNELHRKLRAARARRELKNTNKTG